MINKMDTVLTDLEQKEKQLKEQVNAVEKSIPDVEIPVCVATEELVRIDELMSAIKKARLPSMNFLIHFTTLTKHVPLLDPTSSR